MAEYLDLARKYKENLYLYSSATGAVNSVYIVPAVGKA